MSDHDHFEVWNEVNGSYHHARHGARIYNVLVAITETDWSKPHVYVRTFRERGKNRRVVQFLAGTPISREEREQQDADLRAKVQALLDSIAKQAQCANEDAMRWKSIPAGNTLKNYEAAYRTILDSREFKAVKAALGTP